MWCNLHQNHKYKQTQYFQADDRCHDLSCLYWPHALNIQSVGGKNKWNISLAAITSSKHFLQLWIKPAQHSGGTLTFTPKKQQTLNFPKTTLILHNTTGKKVCGLIKLKLNCLKRYATEGPVIKTNVFHHHCVCMCVMGVFCKDLKGHDCLCFISL